MPEWSVAGPADSLTLPKSPARLGSTPATNASDGNVADATGKVIFAGGLVEGVEIQYPTAIDKIIRDQDSADGSEQAAVGDEPGEDVSVGIGDQFPRHHEDADDAGDESAGAAGNQFGGELGKIVGG